MIIVTGSQGGIGRAIAKAFLEDDKEVLGFDTHNCDLSKKEEIDAALAIVKGKVECLVNCAGVSLPLSGNYSDLEKWDRTFAVNVRAPFYLSSQVTNKMWDGGSIINITSLNAHQGFSINPAYVASKGALSALTRAMAKDFAHLGIRVNSVCPGYIHTSMTDASFNDPFASSQRTERMMIKRWGTPEDVVGAVLFLASDAAKYITGAEIVVDGGFLAKGI